MKLFTFFTLFGVCILGINALPYKADSGVINLTKDNFAKLVFSSEHIWLIEIYAPWCGHCKALAPEWEKLAKNMKGIVKVGAINGDEERDLAGYFQVKGFPTIKFFGHKLTPTPDGKGYHKVPEDYNGARSAAALANFAVSKLPSFVTSVTSKNYESFVSGQPELSKVILFTNKKDTSNLYKALSIDFHNTLALSEIRDKEADLVKQYNIEKFPTLVVVPAAGGDPVKFTGELNHDSLMKFLKPFAKAGSSQPEPEAPSKPKKEPEVTHDLTSEVTQQDIFEKLCQSDKHSFCVMAFLDPTNSEAEEQKRYLATLSQVNEKYGKNFKFLWLDPQKQSAYVDTFQLYSGFPSMILYSHKKKCYVSYLGAFNDESIGEFLDKVLIGKAKPIPIDALPAIAAKPKDEL